MALGLTCQTKLVGAILQSSPTCPYVNALLRSFADVLVFETVCQLTFVPYKVVVSNDINAQGSTTRGPDSSHERAVYYPAAHPALVSS
jgi:hypothetical protein